MMIPTEPVTELRNGKKYTIERVFLPGYVLVEMDLDNDLWHVIKNTPRVTGFLGTGDKPVALSEQEVSSILFRSDVAKDKPSMKIKFERASRSASTRAHSPTSPARSTRSTKTADLEGHGHASSAAPPRSRSSSPRWKDHESKSPRHDHGRI